MAQKSNSHYAPQLYTNQSVFKSLLNCASEMSLSRNAFWCESDKIFRCSAHQCCTYRSNNFKL